MVEHSWVNLSESDLQEEWLAGEWWVACDHCSWKNLNNWLQCWFLRSKILRVCQTMPVVWPGLYNLGNKTFETDFSSKAVKK